MAEIPINYSFDGRCLQLRIGADIIRVHGLSAAQSQDFVRSAVEGFAKREAQVGSKRAADGMFTFLRGSSK